MNNLPIQIFNRGFDQLAHPEIRLFSQRYSAFQVCGLVGFCLGVILLSLLAKHFELSFLIILSLIVVAPISFLLLAWIMKVVIGRERLIYYHHLIAIVLVSALLLWQLNQPVWVYLDILVLGIGLTHACIRIGCLMVGCCHGKPCAWGICYGNAYQNSGFTPYYLQVRLFPIQGVEALWGFFILLVGITLIWQGSIPGEVSVWYLVTYGWGRFYCEFWRGDPATSYWRGFSEAQWTSLLLMLTIVVAEIGGFLPLQKWPILASICVATTMITLSLKRQFQPTKTYRLLNPRHVQEVYQALKLATQLTPESSNLSSCQVACTSLGIKISASRIKIEGRHIHHYTFSDKTGNMTQATARTIAKLILQFTQSFDLVEFIERSQGVFHLLIYPAA